IRAIAHRIVHGAALNHPLLVSGDPASKSLEMLEQISTFAPLHNFAALGLIKACLEIFKGKGKVPENYACFDTVFHAELPAEVRTYPIHPHAAASGLPGGMELRKWGFHGLAYASVLSQMARHLGKPENEVSIIAAHLGSGTSLCAIAKGKPVDTTMGLTPLEGLPGSTRSGSVDPALSHHIVPSREPCSEGAKISKRPWVLNTQSGFKALAGTTIFSDVVKLTKDEEADPAQRAAAQLTFDLFVDRVVGYLGSYYFKLSSHGAIDAVVFSGGIGENSVELRESLADKLASTPICISNADEGHQVQRSSGVSRITYAGLKPGEMTGIPWFICEVSEWIAL
ncbi:actin-like ATPase domain-containing protein, partial [Violaceomyces palustris]